MTQSNWKKQRKINSIPIFSRKIYIFCEGEKTEPNYFNEIKYRIENKALYKNSVFVNVEGVGKGTLKILDYAEKYIKRNKITEGEVWIVYDKDNFTDQDFNAVAVKAHAYNQTNDKIKYNVAWSNQCIEYWFILHFDYYIADNDRNFYIQYLDKKFKTFGLDGYKKNDENIFNILEKYGDCEKAIRYAEKRLEELYGFPDAKSVPATKVHLLYKHLKPYME